jgi:hypothetical protein
MALLSDKDFELARKMSEYFILMVRENKEVEGNKSIAKLLATSAAFVFSSSIADGDKDKAEALFHTLYFMINNDVFDMLMEQVKKQGDTVH